ncbi:hypothetical protein V500_10212, partial [Pseudogymnoascus sp. VKM F-4518 (FW-2643)]
MDRRHCSGSSFRPEKRKDRDWDGDDLDDKRSRRLHDDRFHPENINRLFWKYQTEWHLKQRERFLTRQEFTDLVVVLRTTKITTVHDEGMRRLKEGKTRERVSTDSYKPSGTSSIDSYRPSGSRTMSIASLASQSSSRTPTPQPRARCPSASLTATHEPSQSPEPPSENRLSRAPSNPPPPPKITTRTMIEPQPAPTKTEPKHQPSDILAMTPRPTSTSPGPPHTPLPTASPSPSAIIEQDPQQSPSLRKPRFAPLESPKPRSQTQSEAPPLPPQQQQQQRLLSPYIPPTPAELADAISIIHAVSAAEDAEARARHVRQVKAARALVWIEAVKLAGDTPCLAELIAGASVVVGTEKKGPEGMTESAM